MNTWLLPSAILLGGYLLGSVPFGLFVTRLGGLGDLRAIGSGNIGATNVLRTGRKGLAVLTLLLDGGKGAVAVLLAEALAPGLGTLAAVGAFYGHIFPVWLGFHGGKGIATYLGIALAACWPGGLAFIAVWLGGAVFTRHSSVGGMAAAALTPAVAAYFDRPVWAILFLAFGVTTMWTHRQNIGRLIAGTETRIGQR